MTITPRLTHQHESVWAGLRWLGRLPAWFRLTLISLAVLTCGVIASRPLHAFPEQPLTGEIAAAQRTVTNLTHPRADGNPLADLPADFTAVTGVTPLVVRAPDGTVRATHPGGECSGPDGDTRWDYGVGCRAHDLGYDLLRYAQHKGQPLGPEARRQLDHRLSVDMHAQCEVNPLDSGRWCHVVASAYTFGMDFNSWRQRWGPPSYEPVLSWGTGLVAIILLLVARLASRSPAPARVAAPSESDPAGEQLRFPAFLLLASLAVVVLGQTALSVAHWLDVGGPWLWVLVWGLQAIPVFFCAAGQVNLADWERRFRLSASAGGRHLVPRYLAHRVAGLLRPALAFVLAWLLLPVPLELLGAPTDRLRELGRLLAQPLWLLGMYLVLVVATPVMARLHRLARLGTPLVLAAGVLAADLVRLATGASVAGYLGVLLTALLLHQVGFVITTGGPRRRWPLLGTAVLCLAGLVVLLSVPGLPQDTTGLPGEASTAPPPPTMCLLLLGAAQLCLVLALKQRLTDWLGQHRPWRIIILVRSVPMTSYLAYLVGLTLLLGLFGVLNDAGRPDRLVWLVALVLLALPLLAALHDFERHQHRLRQQPATGPGAGHSRLAVVLGACYGTLGILGFVVTGFAGSATLVVLPVDPLQNIIHVLLGWYLVHVAHAGARHPRLVWLLTAFACLPPLLAFDPAAAVAPTVVLLHGATMAVALLALVISSVRRRALRLSPGSASRPATR